MRNFKHLSPRYIKNKLAVILDEKLYPDKPWLTKDSVELLQQLLKKTDIGVEFGSGRSTHWFLSKIASLKSIETDQAWFEKVKSDCEVEIEEKRLDFLYAETDSEFETIISEIEDESIDFCLVDGVFRDLCAVNMVDKIARGGILVVDNINWYIPCEESHSPNTLRAIDGCQTETWTEFLTRVEGWRYIWTTNGVSDTSLWIRR